MHIASAVRSALWTGDPDKVAFGPAPPAFITGICVAPGATNPGPIGAGIVEQSRLIAPNIDDVVVDRGYSTKREKFCRRLHEQGINVTMDYTKTDIDNPKPIKVGRKDQRLLISCGTLFPLWIPEKMQIPPEDANTDWYADRALWRWTRNRKLAGGGGQFLCSQCAGRVSTTAKTRKPRTTSTDGPHLPIDEEYCCVAFASVTVDLLDSFQLIPYGTLAWKLSYGRRNSIETRNSILKDKGGLTAGWCRAFGLAAQTIGAVALAVVHNLKELKRTLARQKRNGTLPEASLNGTNPANPAEEDTSGALATRGPP